MRLLLSQYTQGTDQSYVSTYIKNNRDMNSQSSQKIFDFCPFGLIKVLQD